MKVLLTGGGTGGHIYPALALADNLKINNPNVEFLYIGTADGLEADIVPKAGYAMSYIDVSGFKRKLSMHNVKVIYQFLSACIKARIIIKKFKPDIVIGTGGYVSGPVVFTAKKMGIPCIIHEQNAIPGLTNKFLSRYADKVAVTFPESRQMFKKARKVVITGNPRASEVANASAYKGRNSLGISALFPVVVVVGGSRGAKAINQAMEQLLLNHEDLSYQLVFVTGSVHYDNFRKFEKNKKVYIVPFLYNMPEVLACADLVISRAGATFLAEITSLGIPSILIPSPYVTNNHQLHNAKMLESANAAIIIEEKDVMNTNIANLISQLLNNPIQLNGYRLESKKLGIPDAADLFRKEIYSLVNYK